jgi:hypothetical protein
MTLTRLTFVDVYRDGGSYGAQFATEDGVGFGLWLQRSRMPDAHGPYHRWLFAFPGHVKPSNAVPVVTGSEEERGILSALDEFLAHSNAQHLTADAEASLAKLRQMVRYIRVREPCLPSDLRAAGFIR